jgi:hypothetical protein
MIRERALNAVMELNWFTFQSSIEVNAAGRCIASYATSNRADGKCGLIIAWEKGFIKKELEFHTFLLSFNHEGIKEYSVRKISAAYSKYFKSNFNGYVNIEFPEALSLLHDAYMQNVRFGTEPAKNFENYRQFLDYDIEEVDRVKMLKKLFLKNITAGQFTNIYLSALKRLDYPLLYDLSGFARKKRLGSREEFILSFGEELSEYMFLKSKTVNIKREGKKIIVNAFIIVSTPDDEIMKIDYLLVLHEVSRIFYVDDFHELERCILPEDHSENPMNYRVFCSIYSVEDINQIRRWLENCPDVFLTGEFEKGVCYKLLKTDDCWQKGFDITKSILSEFILTEKELLVYAPHPNNLARMERRIAMDFKLKIFLKNKYYLPVRELYKTVISGESLEVLLKANGDKPWLCSLRASSALLHWMGEKDVLDILRKDSIHKLQLDSCTWYIYKEGSDYQEKSEIQECSEKQDFSERYECKEKQPCFEGDLDPGEAARWR